MKKSKNLIIIGVIIALAVAAGAYFTAGENYQGNLKIKPQSQAEQVKHQEYMKEILKNFEKDMKELETSDWNKKNSVQERDIDCDKYPEECVGVLN